MTTTVRITPAGHHVKVFVQDQPYPAGSGEYGEPQEVAKLAPVGPEYSTYVTDTRRVVVEEYKPEDDATGDLGLTEETISKE